MFDEWSSELKQLSSSVTNCESFLRLFAQKDAEDIARRAVYGIKCDCNCSPRPVLVEQANGVGDVDRGSGTTSSPPEGLGPSLFPAVRDSAQLDTHEEVQWAMQFITYGLTMPAEHWDVVVHSAHIYCCWLRYMVPFGGQNTSPSSTTLPPLPFHYPRALRRDPMRYLDRILSSLCYFFLPRFPEPLWNHPKWFVNSLGHTIEAVNKHLEDQVDLPESFVVVERVSSTHMLHSQLKVTQAIVQAVESVLSNAANLPPNAWDSLLQFCLNISHAVLAPPLPVPSPRPKPTSAAAAGSYPGAFPATMSPTVLSEASGSTAVVTNTTRTTEVAAMDPARLAETIVDQVVSLLMNTWMTACSYCFPRPQMWAALKDCVRVWRHQSVLVYHWCRVLIAVTSHLVGILYSPANVLPGADTPAPPVLPTVPTRRSSVDKFGVTVLPHEMSTESVKESWLRMLYLLGNPVDICDVRTLATPVLEMFKKTTAADRVAAASIHLPYVYHQMLRGLSAVVDGFLGIQPSLAIGIEAALGVPSDLYRPVGSVSPPSIAAAVGGGGVEVDVDMVKSIPVITAGPPVPVHRSSGATGFPDKGSRKNKSSVSGTSMSSGNVPLRASHSVSPVDPSILSASAPQTAGIWQPGGPTAGTGASTVSMKSTHSSAWTISPTSNFLHLRTLAPQWLGPEPNRCLRDQRPEANTLLRLLGSWLFEASVVGAGKDVNLAVISNRAEQFPAHLNFQVGRAEALGALCRIMLYARRGQLAREYLVRFFLCLHYGLETELGRSDYVLSTVLFYSIDLLRVDLPGINILLPRLFAACQLVFRDANMIRPEFITPTLLRRAALHHLMAMVCIPVQFKGLVPRCLIPVANNPKDPPTMNDLRRQLAYLLCDSLEREKDPVNFQMLLTTSVALLEDMAADEQSSITPCPPNQTGEVNRKRLDTTFGFYHQLIPCLCTLLVTDWGSDSVAQYILEILTGLSTVQIWPSNPMLYRETVRQICEFITKQCQRESRDHKRQLHSIIVAAYSCLSSWIVAHARHVLFDRDCLQIVLGTIELGICGQKSKQATSSVPIAKADKKPTPASKRVQDAAESTLSVLLSLAGAYPGVTGSATTCSRLVEDQLIQALAPEDEVRRQPELLQELRQQFQYFWSEPGVLLGILEVSQCREVLKSRGISLNKTEELELPKTIIVLRGPFGRHLWAVRMRQLPIDDPEASAGPVQLAPPSRPKAWGCFLERLLVTIDRNKTMEALTFPASISDIPLVDADSSIGSLEQVGGAPESQSRVEINTIKSLITSQSAKIEEVGLKCLKQRLNAPFPDPLVEAHPPSSDASFQVGRMLLTNLGYLSTNTFAMMELDALKPVGNSEKPAPSPAVPLAQMKGGQATLGSSQLIQSSNTELSAGATPLDRDVTLQACQTFFALDPQNSDIPSIVDSLDRLPTRTADTLLVFYVGAGQSKVDVILSNMKNWNQLSNEFHAFIRKLGSFVEVAKHPGWTGCIETSYHAVDTSVGFIADPTVSSKSTATTPLSAPDGHEFIVYSADALTEFACVCPSDYYLAPVTSFEPEKAEISRRASMFADPPTGGAHRLAQQQSSTTMSGEPGGDPTGGRVAAVWLEHWEDGPVTAGPDNPGWAIQQMTSQLFGCPVTIYIHPLSSKLYRVGVLRAPGRVFDAGPLINGSVLSHRVLGSFVRQTVTNISRRRRLASDQFQPPHVRRKHRICELEQAYRTQLSRSQSIAKETCYCPQVVLKLFTAAA
ncbi:hypothetical protein CRM22_000754 [Opisthorchis felineus]|uniref:Ral GTPase-activating protein subunit alpha/beta N-terminal domain-containing protein n=1 Tax=Opisthorchis felineus TaxID=147828 RepID=A0A4S2MKF2_OPIFE|nr:hypothetical protein CRM22_000754 [Opisthorchis felineus]